MRDLLRRADETPVSMVIAVAYVTLAMLTDPMQPTIAQLMHYGAARAVEVADGEPWRLLTHAFLHGSWWHLAMNLYALLQLGPLVEKSLGSVRFAVLYVVGAVAGGIAGSLWHGLLTPLVGGSGALFAMMGAMLALLARAGRDPTAFLSQPAGRQILGNVAVNLGIGFLVPFISNAAHIGGLLAGFAVTFFFLTTGRSPAPGATAARAALVALFAGALLAALAPVNRIDALLLAWDRTPAGDRRDELRQALGLVETGSGDAIASDAEVPVQVDLLRERRRLDR